MSTGLVILGAGTIGRAFLGQVAAHHDHVHAALGLDLQVLCVATSRLCSGAGPAPLAQNQLQAIAARGISAADPRPYSAYHMREYLASLAEPVVIVDVTASDGIADLLLAALSVGHHVVLANKKPLSAAASIFEAVMRYRAEGRVVRYEATVGAGLPVVRTLQNLVETGDQVLSIDAALSGTLGYICTALQDGVPFSQAVRAAHRAGYTEPDPRDDLSGRDVARKAVILARTCGFSVDLDAIPLSGLGDLGPPDITAQAFLEALEGQDAAIAARVAEARGRDQVLRYVARVTPDSVTTGLLALSRDHPLAALRGTANLVAITSVRYGDSPLVVSGPGAGAAVTAAGVFGDVLAAAGVASAAGGHKKGEIKAMALTDQQRATLRQRLEQERQRLTSDEQEDHDQFVESGQEYDEQFSSLSNHPADTGTETFDQGHHLAIDRMMQANVEQVDHALQRMAEGTYGLCEVCGREIPYERLEALPHATLCVEDQARQDPVAEASHQEIEGMRPV